MRYFRLSIAAVLIVAGAACSDHPSATSSVPNSPGFDVGGGMVGSGNRDDSNASLAGAPTESDTTGATGRGGGMVGSGN
ncbi:MAG TPA: hypothetical protein VE913_03925 [Longimicrobium sp.]|nr:hypothetical protein [Longimicrobium sp.]